MTIRAQGGKVGGSDRRDGFEVEDGSASLVGFFGVKGEEEGPVVEVSGFYRSCKVLCESQGLCLEDLFGEDEARNAEELLAEKRTQVKGVVEDRIAAHRKVFKAKTPAEQKLAAEAAGKEAQKLSYQGHHKTNCPACGSPASISGTAYGTGKVSHEDGEVVVRQPVSPRGLQCTACGLSLSSYAELEVAGLAGRYTRTSAYTPEEYFGLVAPST
jgi:hypothetical protein